MTESETLRNPGLFDGVSDLDYHSDTDWLSSSGIQMLIKPGGPARFRYWLENGNTGHAAHFDEGHAAHAEVLGTGLEIVAVPHKDWKTKDAQLARDQAYDEGKVPLLTARVEIVRAMGAVVRSSPVLMELLSEGRPEVSGYVVDAATWTKLRCRPDYLRELEPGLCRVLDYKTTVDASPTGFGKSATKYGYPIQEATYRRVLRSLGMEVERFIFLAQEKTPPYLWSLHENDSDGLLLAERLVSRGIDIYSECTDLGQWPGYGTDINVMRMSRWARIDAEEALL